MTINTTIGEGLLAFEDFAQKGKEVFCPNLEVEKSSLSFQ
jgi:hypothetical protein